MREFPDGIWVETVSLNVLYSRDKGICQLCRKPCSRNQASRDHIKPVSRGGEHSYANTQLAHKRCNAQKGDQLEAEMMLPSPLRRGRTK